jgi:hypothetical protein
MNGLAKNRLLLLTVAIFPLFAYVDVTFRSHLLRDSVSSADYLMYLYGGMREYIPNPTEPFMFPPVWMILVLALPFATLSYPLQDVQSFGQQVLYRSKSRHAWWLSKCAWSMLCALTYHLVLMALTLLLCLVFGIPLGSEINSELLARLFQMAPWMIREGTLILDFGCVVTLILVSISLNLLQMLLSLFVKPVFSFLTIAIVALTSCYLMSPLLIGNYAMLIRSNTIIDGGLNFTIGALIALVVALGAVFVGMAKFRHYDILEKR